MPSAASERLSPPAEPLAGIPRATLAEWWQQVVDGERRGWAYDLARGALRGLALPYLLALKLNLGLYDSGLRARTTPRLPVVSVGNLSLGGTGKSPAVAYLAQRLRSQGVRPAVVMRGYGGHSRGPARLVSDGQDLLEGPGQGGDEATMLGTMLPDVPVAVGRRRELVIGMLQQQTPAQIILLDDGFQYFRMRRVLDLVLVDASGTHPGHRVFPAGPLREPWSHLGRADQVWLTRVDQASEERLEWLLELVRRRHGSQPPVLTRHRLTGLRGPGGRLYQPEDLAGRRLLAVCGLGNPGAFEQSLREAGAEVIGCRFPDHYPYSARDLEAIRRRERETGAEGIVLTDKDAVKLLPEAPGEWWVAQCELEVLEGARQVAEALRIATAAARNGSDG